MEGKTYNAETILTEHEFEAEMWNAYTFWNAWGLDDEAWDDDLDYLFPIEDCDGEDYSFPLANDFMRDKGFSNWSELNAYMQTRNNKNERKKVFNIM